MTTIKGNLIQTIEVLSRERQHKLLYILSEISQLMLDEASGHFDGAQLVKEYKTKNMTMSIRYGKAL